MSALAAALGLQSKAAGVVPTETDVLAALQRTRDEKSMSRVQASDLFVTEARDRWPSDPPHVRTEKLLRTDVGKTLASIARSGPIGRPPRKARETTRADGQSRFDELIDEHVKRHRVDRATAALAVSKTPEGKKAYVESRA